MDNNASPNLDPTFRQQVQDALSEVASRDVGPITADRPLADLGLDSVALAELLVVLEDKLDVSIEDNDLAEVKTFGDLGRLVARLTSSAPQARPGPPQLPA